MKIGAKMGERWYERLLRTATLAWVGAMMLLALGACQGGEARVSLDLTALTQKAALDGAQVDVLELRVIAPELKEALVHQIDPANPVFDLVLPAGLQRSFSIDAQNHSTDRVSTHYWGRTTQDLPGGSVVDLVIPAYPAGRAIGALKTSDDRSLAADVRVVFRASNPREVGLEKFSVTPVDGVFEIPLPVGGYTVSVVHGDREYPLLSDMADDAGQAATEAATQVTQAGLDALGNMDAAADLANTASGFLGEAAQLAGDPLQNGNSAPYGLLRRESLDVTQGVWSHPVGLLLIAPDFCAPELGLLSDVDGDGLDCSIDCDDRNPNCGDDCTDNDLDGFCAARDCDDDPATGSVCNSNCGISYPDLDGDGVGNGDLVHVSCMRPEGFVELGADCDDTVAACSVGCEDKDNDGVFDCKDACIDRDGDGWGVPGGLLAEAVAAGIDVSLPAEALDGSSTAVVNASITVGGQTVALVGFAGCALMDCNDDMVDVYPGAPEFVADGIDQNCDFQELCFVDGDGDGLGGADATALSSDLTCSENGVSASSDDCDEAGSLLNLDLDHDGQSACHGDCDDSDPSVYVGADEICDGRDNDCNGVTDDIDKNGDGQPDMGLAADGTLLDLLDGDGVPVCWDNCPFTPNPAVSPLAPNRISFEWHVDPNGDAPNDCLPATYEFYLNDVLLGTASLPLGPGNCDVCNVGEPPSERQVTFTGAAIAAAWQSIGQNHLDAKRIIGASKEKLAWLNVEVEYPAPAPLFQHCLFAAYAPGGHGGPCSQMNACLGPVCHDCGEESHVELLGYQQPDLDWDGRGDACDICNGVDTSNNNGLPHYQEICGNFVDDDCNGIVDDLSQCPAGCTSMHDFDGDGYFAAGSGCNPDPSKVDCDDTNAFVHPDKDEIGFMCSDGYDNNCNGMPDVADADCTGVVCAAPKFVGGIMAGSATDQVHIEGNPCTMGTEPPPAGACSGFGEALWTQIDLYDPAANPNPVAQVCNHGSAPIHVGLFDPAQCGTTGETCLTPTGGLVGGGNCLDVQLPQPLSVQPQPAFLVWRNLTSQCSTGQWVQVSVRLLGNDDPSGGGGGAN